MRMFANSWAQAPTQRSCSTGSGGDQHAPILGRLLGGATAILAVYRDARLLARRAVRLLRQRLEVERAQLVLQDLVPSAYSTPRIGRLSSTRGSDQA